MDKMAMHMVIDDSMHAQSTYSDMVEMQTCYSGGSDEEAMYGSMQSDSQSLSFNYASHPFGHDEFMSNHYHDYEADNEYMMNECGPSSLQQTLLHPCAHVYGHGVRMYPQPQALASYPPTYALTESGDSPSSVGTVNNADISSHASTITSTSTSTSTSSDTEHEPPIEHKTEAQVRSATTTSMGLTMAPLRFSLKRTNLIIWDFDDTIFPTSAFRSHHERKDKLFMQKLTVFVAYVRHIFETMIGLYGASNIVIVTNASGSWIHKCLNVDLIQATFMPLQRLLKKHSIQTISASTADITSRYPKNHLKWKEVAFARLFANHFNLNDEDDEDDNNYPMQDTLHCITSIGDSICEYDASHSASKCIENRILHRVRLKGNPTIDDMLVQLKEIASMVHLFGSNVNDMDVNLCSLAQTFSNVLTTAEDATH